MEETKVSVPFESCLAHEGSEVIRFIGTDEKELGTVTLKALSYGDLTTAGSDVVKLAAKSISSWTLVDGQGVELALSEETINALPPVIVQAIAERITALNFPSAAQKKTSVTP